MYKFSYLSNFYCFAIIIYFHFDRVPDQPGQGTRTTRRRGLRHPGRRPYRWWARAQRSPSASRTRVVERLERRGTEPFELFRSEFGQNSWNPKKTTKRHFFEVAADPKDTTGPQEKREKGNKLHWGSEAYDDLAPSQKMLYLPSKDAMLAFKRGYACLQNMIEVPSAGSRCE